MNRDGMWDITTYTHHAFGYKKKKAKTWDCKDEHEPGASSEASCIWNAIQLCVASLTSSTNGNTSLYFQSCMDNPNGPEYVPYDWLEPSNSKKGHAPYKPSAFTLGCLSKTTDVTAEDFQSCLGLDGETDNFIGSPGHTMLLKDFEYSEKTFKDAGVEEAGPTIFIDGKLAYQGNCADTKGKFDESCKYDLLDLICNAHTGEKPAGCAHSAAVV